MQKQLEIYMSITLKPEQEKLIQQQVELGRFNSADEALERALQLLDEQYQDSEAWIEEMRVKVDVAKAQVEQGEVIALETVMNRLQDKFRQARENQG
jgi:antitoxin ParD1/3/4